MKNAKQLSGEGRRIIDHRVAEVDGIEICAIRYPPPLESNSYRPSLQSVSNENGSTRSSRAAPAPPSLNSICLDKFDHWPLQTTKDRCRNPD
ncbi:unnamed protein product, partial [Rotaria sordida]